MLPTTRLFRIEALIPCALIPTGLLVIAQLEIISGPTVATMPLLTLSVIVPFVTVGGAPAQVLFSGLAPGSVGEYQVNVLVPAAASRGPAMPVIMFVGDGVSNLVNIAVE